MKVKGDKIMGKRLSVVCFAVALMMFFGVGSAFSATAKATCAATEVAIVDYESAADYANPFKTPIFTQTIHSASQKDLFIDVSLECGLTTNTKVMSKNLVRAIAEAEAYVKVSVEVDGVEAEPGEVTFARRYQALIADLAGYVDFNDAGCLIADPETGITTLDEACVEEEMVALVLDTMTANSFNFVFGNLAAGDHEVVVYAEVGYNTSDGLDISEIDGYIPTRAYLGKGSVTVESVRLVKDELAEVD
ncbi:hypothetical protein [Desulfosediminicola sp.]|uniref:hypothetical protein n=1 Tax=Desulfosediminicola sp. TaxID=2886825 RepID=UPI003AF2E59F